MASSAQSPVEARLRVRYAETDQMGIVYYANYLVWMEVGRVEYCRAAGIRYRDMEVEDGILLTVAEAAAGTFARALRRRGDRAHLDRGRPSRDDPVRLRDDRGRDGRRLATGETKHVFCGRDRKPRKLPEKYHPSFGIGGTGLA